MGIEQEIEAIRSAIRAGKFANEAAVSQGIVLRLLHSLEWPTYDTQAVWPEYSLSGRRVDFALCSPPGRPIALVEVKQIGQSDGAERQLFEYAFHDGVPMAILTDGREWNFFLPGERGDYGERRVYKLDLVDRDIKECVGRLQRYLLHSAVASGEAIKAARDDYQNVSRDRQMLATLPQAWSQIIAEEDEMMLEIVADRVESLCGFKPSPDMVAAFLKENVGGRALIPPKSISPQATAFVSRPFVDTPATITPAELIVSEPIPAVTITAQQHQIGFRLDGVFYPGRNAIDTLKQILESLSGKDPSFPERFAALPHHGRTRRYLAKNPVDLYPGRPDLVRDHSVQLRSGWWMGTNYSRQTIRTVISLACEVANITPDRDLVAHLGN